VKQGKQKHNSFEQRRKMEAKRMHGQSPSSLDEQLVGKEQSYQLLKFGDFKGDTESTTVAVRVRHSVQTALRENSGRRNRK